MRREFQPDLECNLDSPLLNNIGFCKSIRPKNQAAGESYCGMLPRIVKSNFKVPANWEVVQEVTEGQVLDRDEHRGSPVEYVHTCTKPFDKCIDGFWTKARKLDPQENR
jgi:hypothetical protein